MLAPTAGWRRGGLALSLSGRHNRLMIVIVMGVSGAGKSTIAALLATELGATFIDADDLHPVANVEKMRAGIPLTDLDRAPWLSAVAAAGRDTPGDVVIACSALKRAYREHIASEAGEPVAFIHLTARRELLAERMGAREGHFMPTSLLDSQLATLEPLAADEPGVTLDVAGTPAELVRAAVAHMRAG